MITYRITFNTQAVQALFARMKGDAKQASSLVLERTGKKIVANTQENYLTGQVLKVRTGRLRGSLYSHVVGGDRLKIGASVVYAAIHEFGGIIVPRRAKWLMFRIGGRWIRTKKVTMPKRPYLSRAISEFFDSGEAQRLGEETLH